MALPALPVSEAPEEEEENLAALTKLVVPGQYHQHSSYTGHIQDRTDRLATLSNQTDCTQGYASQARDPEDHKPSAYPAFSASGLRSSQRFAPVRVSNVTLIKNAFLDNGCSFVGIEHTLAEDLGLEGVLHKGTISAFGAVGVDVTGIDAPLGIARADGELEVVVECGSMDRQLVDFTVPNWAVWKKRWPHMEGLYFGVPVAKGKIRLILGTSVPFFHRILKEIPGPKPTHPVAQLSPLGWTAIGPIQEEKKGDKCQAARPSCLLPVAYALCAHNASSLPDRPAHLLLNEGDRRAVALLSEKVRRLEDSAWEALALWKT